MSSIVRHPEVTASRRVQHFAVHGRLARTPVNASPPSLRAATHDSGPVWLATPSPYDSCIHDIPPVFIVGKDGRIAFKGPRGPQGFQPPLLEAAIEKELADSGS